MISINNINLKWNETGTPFSEQFNDVYFSNVDGLEETRHVFFKHNNLSDRWQTHNQRRFVIAETGFGTGLNFLAAWQLFEDFREKCPNATLKELHFISFEKFPLRIQDLERAHKTWPELANYAKQLQRYYPITVPECHRIVLADGAITLDLWFGDIKECMPLVPTNKSGIVDAWFLDGFAPSKNPEMWSQDLFNGVAKLAKQECTCATFTAAGFVRRGLIDAGFHIKKVKGFGTKREMLAGILERKIPYSNIQPWFARPASSEPEIKEVAIIGGGIASAALAATLGQRGIHVTLYCEDAEAAQNASGNRQGALYPLLNKTHSSESRVYAPAFLFARQFFDHASQHVNFDHDWCGVTHLAWNDKESQKLNNIIKGMYNPALVKHITPVQMNNVVGLPTDLEGINYPMGGWLCPQEFTQKLLQKLVDSGRLTLIYRTKITKIKQNNSHNWILYSEHGHCYEHQVLVVANGHQSGQFTQTAPIPLSPVKGQVSHVPTTPKLKLLKTVLCYNGYMTPHNPSNKHHCIGASHDRKNIDQNYDPKAQQENMQKLHRSLPNQEWVKEVDISANQAKQGIRSTSRDHLPFVGNVCDFKQVKEKYSHLLNEQNNAKPIADYPNLYCFLGLGGRGLCSAPLMAEILASQICNDPLPLPVDSLETIHPGRMWVRKLLKGRPV